MSPSIGAPGRHFTWAELTTTGTGLPNVPGQNEMRGLITLCSLVLDPLRERLGRPVLVKSAYRSPAVNKKVGGAHGSVHEKGWAADIKVDGLDAAELTRAILSAPGVVFDQVIWYAPERGGHVHVGIRLDGAARGDVMHAPTAGGYVTRKP